MPSFCIALCWPMRWLDPAQLSTCPYLPVLVFNYSNTVCNNSSQVFNHYQSLLNSDNYVTKRQSLKLLGELLLDRHNFSVMTKYISNPDNLKLMMMMLKEKSRNIQFEAFHVFKVFVANPNKPKAILDILLRNQEKLVDFLSKFHTDRLSSDEMKPENQKAVFL